MRKLSTMLVFLLFAGLQVAFAQRTVTGRVTSATDDSPLVGVTIRVKGTLTGSVTDANFGTRQSGYPAIFIYWL
jgi:hypothetical protein